MYTLYAKRFEPALRAMIISSLDELFDNWSIMPVVTLEDVGPEQMCYEEHDIKVTVEHPTHCHQVMDQIYAFVTGYMKGMKAVGRK